MDYYVPGSQRMSSLSTESGQLSATVTMTLMQMVADVYEEARVEWERNSQREMLEGIDDPQLFGPNEAQLAVEGWLVRAQFLPARERPRREVAKEVEIGVTTLPQVPRKSPAKSVFSLKRLPTVTWRLFPPTRICKFASRFKVPHFLSLHFPKSWKSSRPTSGFDKIQDPVTVSISVDAHCMLTPSTPTSSVSSQSSTEPSAALLETFADPTFGFGSSSGANTRPSSSITAEAV
ncbi:hypothetical protein HYPSUDRAFT_198805 [Hypholoma sublateritium FD-334 SS-4]|uniref:Uncharacterized protein n=1 Tax=Hypholoma sublateritium (strain FD-334 SS-4) TaxID=945553 RepID=A0A0D2LFW4_HYPSF|nr:hypothetical protein HYPSUDRAFT_198805 [Hypholoma sublateritium FD-334 SS-4]